MYKIIRYMRLASPVRNEFGP